MKLAIVRKHQRMTGMPVLGWGADAHWLTMHAERDAIHFTPLVTQSLRKLARRAPCENDLLGIEKDFAKPIAVVRPYRIIDRGKLADIGRSVCEEVADDQVAPAIAAPEAD